MRGYLESCDDWRAMLKMYDYSHYEGMFIQSDEKQITAGLGSYGP